MEFMLARIYFALAITFHIVFPAINIGLSWLILIMESIYVKTGDEKYLKLCKFWTRIFAMLFGVGVVTGIMMSFMFGLTFSKLIDIGGNILGPLLSFEVLTAFFLEASFLGVMLFGWKKVSKKAHLFATFCVAIGTMLSAFWILSANSFMQTPDGYAIENGILIAKDWYKIIFNPSFPYKFLHMTNAAIMTGSVLMFGISVYMIKHNKDKDFAKISAKISAYVLLFTSILQVFLGDLHGLHTLKYQPAKIAALEGHWENEKGGNGQPIVLFGIPNEKERRNDYEITIPRLGSILLTHTLDGDLPALNDFKDEDRPPVLLPFFCFRIMVGCGLVMILIGIWGVSASRRNKIGLGYSENLTKEQEGIKCHKLMAPIHKIMTNISIWCIPIGAIATICGWYVTEVGRQPWVVYGILRSKEAITPNLDAVSVIFGISFTLILYAAISVILVRYIYITVKKGISFDHA